MSDNAVRPLLNRSSASIMGIINATPDSFSDGGQFNSTESAFKHGLALLEEGADILDIGGESTRPGAHKVGVQEELDRVIPIIERLVSSSDAVVSIDTQKPEVMRSAVQAGAQMVNDVNGLQAEGALQAASELGVPVCIMHMHGDPSTMQNQPKYDNVVAQVMAFYQERIEACKNVGIATSDIILDPGIGFGKLLEHNLQLLKSVPQMKSETGCEILIGVSRKSLINDALGRDVNERLSASIGLAVQSVLNGAKIVRVHDVRATHDAIRMIEAVRDQPA